MYYQKIYIGSTFLILAQTKSDFYILTKIFTWIVYLFIIVVLIITLHSYCVVSIYKLLRKKKKKKKEAHKGNFDFIF